MIYNWHTVPVNTRVWGCNYTLNSYKDAPNYKQEPVLGMVIKRKWDSHFVELKKDGSQKKSGMVYYQARVYADTYEECVTLYNSLIQDCIVELQSICDSLMEQMLEVE